MLSYDKELKTLSQHLRKNMTDAFVKSPLTPLCQRGERRERIFAKEGERKRETLLKREQKKQT